MQGTILLMAGLVAVILGANWLVDGAVAVARRLKVSDLAVGLTLVAFGTSLPELTVNVVAAIQNQPDVAIGNVVGSNICNILLILGISAMIYPLKVGYGTVWKEIPLCFLAAVVLLVSCGDSWLDGTEAILSRSEGIVLLGFFVVFLYYTAGLQAEEPEVPLGGRRMRPSFQIGLLIIGGLAFLIAGGKATVEGAVSMASAMGISEGFISLTIVAVGTSIPELATSAVAAYKKNADISMGNVVGSNIFNTFFILGVSALLRPLPISNEMMFSLIASVAAAAILFICMFTGSRHKLDRWEALLMLLLYGMFLVLQYKQ
ncbi:MAG: calcium/sodium antiporter [Planctomycetaceae bacterium]|nr:calcium/sodium antiporter [Planctomycetaceae bacterium]